jgi:hypothetical protein
MQFEDDHLPILTSMNISEKTKNVEYRICGKVHLKAKKLKYELDSGEKKSFESIIHLNIGDVQAFGQKPLTFVRQVSNMVIYNSF